jgi:hypothetical protein
MLYHLSLSPSLLSYFSGRILQFCLGPASDQDHPTYGPSPTLCRWDHSFAPPQYLAYWLRWGLTTFLPRLPLSLNRSVQLSSSWDYRCEPPCQAKISSFFLFNYYLYKWSPNLFVQVRPFINYLNLFILLPIKYLKLNVLQTF